MDGLTNADLNAMMPKLTREFPEALDFLLPLRFSAKCYDRDGGTVPLTTTSPETDSNENSSGEMYTMTAQIPICGHASYVKPSEDAAGFMMVCEPVYAHLNANEMIAAIQTVNKRSLKWINMYEGRYISPIRPPNELIHRTVLAYRHHGPLLVYTNVAAIEAANHSGDSNFWRNLYPPMDLVECHYGLAGLLYDNSVLSMGDSVGKDESTDIETRRPKPYHRGFMDVCFTPQSKGAGRVRMLSFGVTIRVMTTSTIKLACRLISTIGVRVGTGFGDWILRCMGFTTAITHRDVVAIINEWKTMCEFNMPTVHVFESLKTVVLSITSGVLIRPLRTIVSGSEFVRQGPYVDSMCVYHSDTMRYLGMSFPKPEVEVMQFTCTSSLLIPFFRWTTEPRPNLGIQMMMQAMNSYPIKGDATIVSLNTNKPVITTQVADAIISKSSDSCRIVIPGRNIVVAFINRTLNTEDACSISEEFANSGNFAWMGYIEYPIPRDAGVVEPGTMLENQHWWKPARRGTVLRVFTNKAGSLYATAVIHSKDLMIGDKLATWHGLKFTVGEIMPLRDMPTLIDTVTRESFKPNMLISTKNLNRGLGGQIREMNAYMSGFTSVNGFRSLERYKGKNVISQSDELGFEPRIPVAYVTHNGKRIEFRDTNGDTRTVKCQYGIMRVMQLRHLSSLKQHYPSSRINSLTVPRGRYRSGTPRTGETEIISMMMQGLNICASEAVISSDKAIVTVCSRCAAIPIYCDCPFPKPNTTEVAVRYSAVQLNAYATTAMLNDEKGVAMTLRYLTST